MKYTVSEIGGLFCVLEKQTEHIIQSFYDEKEAKKLMRHLNFGGGFDGWTPSFFVKSLRLSDQFD